MVELFEHFLSNFQYGPVIIEEKIDGEESSFQAFCDGKHLVPWPDTRDYKRAFDGDKGPNTGGMGSYKGKGDVLPFLTNDDRAREMEIVKRIFDSWRKNDNIGLRGVPLYVAFMHTGNEPKILENNSRPGDPELMNIIPILKDDFVDVCFKILECSLTRIGLEKAATVVAYKVPPTYGGYMEAYPENVDKKEIDTPVDLSEAYGLCRKYKGKIRVYPGAMELRDCETYALKSRTVAVVGVGADIEMARRISLEGIKSIKGGALWHRTDIASEKHIEASRRHMEALRSEP